MNRSRFAWLGMVSVLIAAAAVWPILARAQPGQTGAVTGIAGRVVDALSGEPVPRVQITLRTYGTGEPLIEFQSRRVETGPDGTFEYANVPVGSAVLSASAEGYLTGAFGRDAPWDYGLGLQLAADERLTDVVIKVWPAGTISGTVRDERGEPVVQASVRPLLLDYVAGERRWNEIGRPAASMVTDDRGMYRLTGLQPGEYIVTVPAPGSGTRPARGTLFYETAFFGGSRSARDARVITVTFGERVTGADVQVTIGTNGPGRFPVSGRIAAGALLTAPITVRLLPPDDSAALGSFEEFSVTTTVQGTFSFPGVPAGQYRLQAWHFPELPKRAVNASGQDISNPVTVPRGNPVIPAPPTDPTWVADFPVTVDRALTDLPISLRPAARITGRVVFDGEGRRPTGDDLLRVPIVVDPAFRRTLGVVPGTRVEADGRFTTVGLPPGPYTLLVQPDSSGVPGASEWRLSSVTSSGRAIVGRPIDVGTDDVDVTFTFTNRSATITGTIRDASGVARGDARLIAFARNPDMRGYGLAGVPQCVQHSPPDRHGAFTLLGLSPLCDYLLAAVTNMPRLWMAPDYLESLVPFAVPAAVQLNEVRTVNLVARP